MIVKLRTNIWVKMQYKTEIGKDATYLRRSRRNPLHRGDLKSSKECHKTTGAERQEGMHNVLDVVPKHTHQVHKGSLVPKMPK